MSRRHPYHQMRETSLDAYRQVELADSQRHVYDTIWEHTMRGDPPTDREIAKELGQWDPNKVRPRRHELMEAGLIEEAGKRHCRVTGRKALTWRVK